MSVQESAQSVALDVMLASVNPSAYRPDHVNVTLNGPNGLLQREVLKRLCTYLDGTDARLLNGRHVGSSPGNAVRWLLEQLAVNSKIEVPTDS